MKRLEQVEVKAKVEVRVKVKVRRGHESRPQPIIVSLALLLFLPAMLLAGGPDRGGYRWIDSDTTGGPTFNWVDITGSGTRIPLADDDNQGPFALGFSLNFYGTSRDSIRVCSNGWLSFISQSHQFHPEPIPDTRDPNSLIAPLWADLDPSQGGSVYYLADTAHGRFIVSWMDVPSHGSGGSDSFTFQVVLDTSGGIVFQYLRLPAPLRLGTDSCSVGIENDSGQVGLEYLYNDSPAENELHDSLAVRFYRLHLDACPVAVLRPVGSVLAADSIRPLVDVRNTGLDSATFPAILKIGGGYQETLTVSGLAPLTDKMLQFPAWMPGADTYALELVTSLGGDQSRANDTLRTEVAASYIGELRYENGERDTWYMKNGSPTHAWAGAVRFSVPYSHYRLLKARVYVDDTTPFSSVMVCPDSSGAPQCSSPYVLVDSVAASQPDTWLEVAADTEVATGGDVWLLAFWQPHATEPQIGEDRHPPIDGRSYFGSPTASWFTYSSGDIMARLRIDGRTGISEIGRVELPRLSVSPNPFSRATVVCLRGLVSPRSTVRILDVTGRSIRDLSLSDAGIASWDGRDEKGRRLPAGAYFVEARAGAGRQVARALFVR
ncbi:MAG TPA: nidogen-like domain-containing protein [bacterium]|nr:nidogen-like domain-containing protein [bacterium]